MKKLLLLLILVFSIEISNAQEKIYTVDEIEVLPEFPGGNTALLTYITENLNIPPNAKFKGNLEISFIVDLQGKLTNFKIVNDLGFGIGAELIRVFNEGPNWSPCKLKNGTIVKAICPFEIALKSR